MKEPDTALFIAPTGVRKTHLALSLLETEYRNHFDFIVIICPTLRHNSTYKNRSWVWNDPDVIPIEPGNQLYYLIEKISNLLSGDKTLFLIDDIIADETLDKHHQPLLELAISGRHRGHSSVADPDRCHGFQETYENCPHKFNTIYKFCS